MVRAVQFGTKRWCFLLKKRLLVVDPCWKPELPISFVLLKPQFVRTWNTIRMFQRATLVSALRYEYRQLRSNLSFPVAVLVARKHNHRGEQITCRQNMQLTTTGSLSGNRQIKAAVMGLIVVGVIWELAAWIVAGSDKNLIMFGLSLVVVALVVHILNDWRSGVLLFLVWLLFEDLARKYLGNSMTVYFAKDFLVGIAYFSFYFAKRRREVDIFKSPFLVPLGIFFALAFVQVFNTFSPNIMYGLLGLKLYFYYVPLMFLGYAMLKRPEDLDRLLKVSLVAGIVISGLGIAQSVLGVSFLTPEDSAAELYELSHLVRYSPVTHQEIFAPSSVFVSAGRFSFYLILLWILAMGAQGYLLLSRKPGAKYGFWGIGVVTVAVMITGTRTPFVFVIGSAFVMTAAFLWGAPWRWGQGHRMVKALRRGFLIGGLGLILMVEVFPTVIGGNWSFFTETLSLQRRRFRARTPNLGLPRAKSYGRHRRRRIAHRTRHRLILVGNAICFQFLEPAPAGV